MPSEASCELQRHCSNILAFGLVEHLEAQLSSIDVRFLMLDDFGRSVDNGTSLYIIVAVFFAS